MSNDLRIPLSIYKELLITNKAENNGTRSQISRRYGNKIWQNTPRLTEYNSIQGKVGATLRLRLERWSPEGRT